MPVKIAVSLLLLFASGSVVFFYVRAGNTGLVNANGMVPVALVVFLALITAVVLMALPRDIKQYPPGRKFLIGAGLSLLLIILCLAAMLAAALLFG